MSLKRKKVERENSEKDINSKEEPLRKKRDKEVERSICTLSNMSVLYG